MYIKRVLVMLLAIGVLLGLSGLAQAQLAEQGTYSGTFGWWAAGKTHELEQGHVFFTGEFTGTFFNSAGGGFLHNTSASCPGVNDLRLSAKKGQAMGYCVVTDSDGHSAYLAWRCEGDTVRCSGTFEWTGGTGKYSGLRGNNEFTGVLGPSNPDGSTSGYATWKGEWKLASATPKPQRMLSEDQRSVIRDALSTEQGVVWFVTQSNDPEASSFQQELQYVFQEAGWEVGSSSEAHFPLKAGLMMFIADEEPTTRASTVLEGLQAAGFQMATGSGYRQYYNTRRAENPGFRGFELAPEQEFVIVIGPNPDS